MSLGYAVCNVDAKQPLYFYWDAPAFGTGWNYPLQLGACATMMRSAIKATVDDKALITFTQHNQKGAPRLIYRTMSRSCPSSGSHG